MSRRIRRRASHHRRLSMERLPHARMCRLESLEPRRMLATHPIAAYLQRHSDPTARGGLFLNFYGGNIPNWNNGQYHPGVTPAYDTDGDPTTFSDAEISQMD